jgi:hypothetical protein
MPDTILPHPAVAPPLGWSGGVTRVPFRVYRDQGVRPIGLPSPAPTCFG